MLLLRGFPEMGAIKKNLKLKKKKKKRVGWPLKMCMKVEILAFGPPLYFPPISEFLHIIPANNIIYWFTFCLSLQERPAKPDVDWLTDDVWLTCCDLDSILPAFKGIKTDITATPVHCKSGRLDVCIRLRKKKVCLKYPPPPSCWEKFEEIGQQLKKKKRDNNTIKKEFLYFAILHCSFSIKIKK